MAGLLNLDHQHGSTPYGTMKIDGLDAKENCSLLPYGKSPLLQGRQRNASTLQNEMQNPLRGMKLLSKERYIRREKHLCKNVRPRELRKRGMRFLQKLTSSFATRLDPKISQEKRSLLPTDTYNNKLHPAAMGDSIPALGCSTPPHQTRSASAANQDEKTLADQNEQIRKLSFTFKPKAPVEENQEPEVVDETQDTSLGQNTFPDRTPSPLNHYSQLPPFPLTLEGQDQVEGDLAKKRGAEGNPAGIEKEAKKSKTDTSPAKKGKGKELEATGSSTELGTPNRPSVANAWRKITELEQNADSLRNTITTVSSQALGSASQSAALGTAVEALALKVINLTHEVGKAGARDETIQNWNDSEFKRITGYINDTLCPTLTKALKQGEDASEAANDANKAAIKTKTEIATLSNLLNDLLARFEIASAGGGFTGSTIGRHDSSAKSDLAPPASSAPSSLVAPFTLSNKTSHNASYPAQRALPAPPRALSEAPRVQQGLGIYHGNSEGLVSQTTSLARPSRSSFADCLYGTQNEQPQEQDNPFPDSPPPDSPQTYYTVTDADLEQLKRDAQQEFIRETRPNYRGRPENFDLQRNKKGNQKQGNQQGQQGPSTDGRFGHGTGSGHGAGGTHQHGGGSDGQNGYNQGGGYPHPNNQGTSNPHQRNWERSRQTGGGRGGRQ